MLQANVTNALIYSLLLPPVDEKVQRVGVWCTQLGQLQWEILHEALAREDNKHRELPGTVSACIESCC